MGSHIGLLGDYVHTRLGSALYERMSRLRIEERHVKTHRMPSVKKQLGREAAGLVAARKVVRGEDGMGSSWSSTWEENAKEERPEREFKSEKRG